MKMLRIFSIVALLVVLLLGYSSIFVVNEGTRGIVIRFGEVHKTDDGQTRVYGPGLHTKLPVFDRVQVLPSRLQTLDGQPSRYTTVEKKDLIVDSYVKWKIDDFSQYYLTTRGNKLRAEKLLSDRIKDGLQAEFGKRKIPQIVSGERDEVMDQALHELESGASSLGIKIVDVRMKQINLPDEVSKNIYDRMRAERNAAAREHRSKGRMKAEVTRAEADTTVTVLIASAEKEAQKLRGEGDAQAARIYSDAYRQEPEFFDFWRSMRAYRSSFDGQSGDAMVLSPDSDFFRYFEKPLQNKK